MRARRQRRPAAPARESGKSGITAFLRPEEMHSLGRLVLRSRYVVEGNLAGTHRSPLRGPSAEFADHKAYGIGDDPKHLDWRLVARTDKYYVKRFEDETNLRVYLALDRSGSMGFGSGKVTKYAFASRLAAALGYVVVKGRDSVGLVLHADRVDVMMEAGNTFLHLDNLLRRVQEHRAASITRVADALHEIAATVRRRGLIVVISDLLGREEDIHAALAHLRKQHHDVIVLHVLDPLEIDLAYPKSCEFVDLETGERMAVNPRAIAAAYRRAFGDFLVRCRETCAGLKIDYRLAPTDQPLEPLVRAYLEERRRLSK